ncbi:hypothetical protein [Mesorhizobium sp. STM 4661]|uniref:hypothetical protein n=1 Tax=Mesorhizobium sp. STM 4661 TaxID=1297570 RepID=UPI0002BD72D0|nr:hypothetical protein [Mesorhizobium sp. STM 4661]CCV15937.1 hypothetical protein MESS4_830157 [Mesorhizobium sp. STM 4661]
MDVGQARSVNVWPYVGLYSLMMIGLTVVFMGISVIFPSLPDSFLKAELARQARINTEIFR